MKLREPLYGDDKEPDKLNVRSYIGIPAWVARKCGRATRARRKKRSSRRTYRQTSAMALALNVAAARIAFCESSSVFSPTRA